MECQHLETHVERENPDSYHYAARVCDKCNARLGYLPRPSNLNKRKHNGEQLKKLSCHVGLTDFERGMCYAMFLAVGGDGKLKLHPAQERELSKLSAKYLT
jgi:hypothetical protein